MPVVGYVPDLLLGHFHKTICDVDEVLSMICPYIRVKLTKHNSNDTFVQQ